MLYRAPCAVSCRWSLCFESQCKVILEDSREGRSRAEQRGDFLKTHSPACCLKLGKLCGPTCQCCTDCTHGRTWAPLQLIPHRLLPDPSLSLSQQRSGSGDRTSWTFPGWNRTVCWPGVWTQPPGIMAPGRARGSEGPGAADGCRTLWPGSRAVRRRTQVREVQCEDSSFSWQIYCIMKAKRLPLQAEVLHSTFYRN